MIKKRLVLRSFATAATMLFYVATVANAADHDHAVKVGKSGDVTFDRETRVGDMTLKAGRYKFNHRVDGAGHFVHFTEWSKPYPGGPSPISPDGPRAYPGEVECRLEFLSKKVSQTTIYTTTEGGVARVTKAEVAGENVVHLF